MCKSKLARYIVDVPREMSISEAVAAHRDATGHGGMCILRFASARQDTSVQREIAAA